MRGIPSSLKPGFFQWRINTVDKKTTATAQTINPTTTSGRVIFTGISPTDPRYPFYSLTTPYTLPYESLFFNKSLAIASRTPFKK